MSVYFTCSEAIAFNLMILGTLRLTIFNIGGPGDIRAAFYSYNLTSPKPYDANTQHPDVFYELKRTGKLKESVVEFDKPLGNNWYYSMKMD